MIGAVRFFLRPMLRVRRDELMDQPGIEPAAHVHALRALNRVNAWLGTDRALMAEMGTFGPLQRLSVLDLGAGGGGLLTRLAGVTAEARDDEAGGRPPLIGLDCSSFALKRAAQWSDGCIRPVVADVRRLPMADRSVDVVVCSLVLHHFSEPDATMILREAARVARLGVLAGDLVRSRLACALTWMTTRAISRSRVFHIDGVRSVQAAFVPRELLAMARAAGMVDADVRAQFPYRMLLKWRRSRSRG